MSIVSHETTEDAVQKNGWRRVIYQFTDHLGGIEERTKIVPAGFDDDADRLATVPIIEDYLAEQEIITALNQAEGLYLNPDKVPPDHQPGATEEEQQANFDRRVLTRVMLLIDAHAVYAAYPMFQAMELRGGANANQRATYLGIDIAIYNQIDDRFSNVNGVGWFLADEKNQVWSELPEGVG